jgi:hypothetical protein
MKRTRKIVVETGATSPNAREIDELLIEISILSERASEAKTTRRASKGGKRAVRS